MQIETTVLDTALLRLLLAIAPWTQQERAEQQRLYAAVCDQCTEAWQAAGVTFTEDDGFSVKEAQGSIAVMLDLDLRDLRLMAGWFAEVRVEPQAIGRPLARAIE